MSQSRKILVVVAHADDEALGAAGTLARHVAEGDEVHLMFLTDGIGARRDDAPKSARESAAAKSAARLGIEPSRIRHHNFPDNAMDSIPLIDIVRAVEDAVTQIQPHTIYTHHHGDLNVDHRLAHQAVLTACRPQPHCPVREIYGMEILSSTEWGAPDAAAAFLPARYVDIGAYFTQKMQALKEYDAEMRPYPHARSYEAIEALSRLRGASVGREHAEAFTVIRQIAG